MIPYVLRGLVVLVRVDLVMRFRHIEGLHSLIATTPVRSGLTGRLATPDQLTKALDYASAFYVKQVLCLQRSAATVLLLRRQGWPATLVIGAQVMPFKSHAWVEVDGEVLNDRPSVTKSFQILSRC